MVDEDYSNTMQNDNETRKMGKKKMFSPLDWPSPPSESLILMTNYDAYCRQIKTMNVTD